MKYFHFNIFSLFFQIVKLYGKKAKSTNCKVLIFHFDLFSMQMFQKIWEINPVFL